MQNLFNLILMKIGNFFATRCQILRLKCIDGGAYSAPSAPLLDLGPTSKKKRKRKEGEREGRGEEEEREEKKGELEEWKKKG